jgi:DNA-binding transcriptional regulator GbsR (MarR family)
MKRDSNGHRMPNLTDEQLIDAVKACHDKSASDIAHHTGYDRSTISRHLKELERNKIVTHRDVRGAGGMLALWSVADDCFKQFDKESEKCKTCCIAVECHEENGT